MAASEKQPSLLRWGRVIAAVLIGFFIAEFGAQVVIYAYAGKPFRSLSLYLWSPYGLVRNNPNLTSPAFVINHQGFRATREYTRQKPPNTFRVILLGGSVLYSGIVPNVARLTQYGRVSSDQTIASYLEAQLRQDP